MTLGSGPAVTSRPQTAALYMEWHLLASGFGLVEGPTIDADGTLVVSDVLNGGVFRVLGDRTVTTVLPKRRGIGGIARHAAGGLVVGGRDLQLVRDGASVPLLALDGVLGFNDFGTDEAGRIYVGTVRYRSLDPTAVHIPGDLWRIDLDGSATMLYTDVQQCNGVGISPDGATIYQADTREGCLIVHDLHDDGATVTNRRRWPMGERAHPDGVAIDEVGCVWVADHGGGRIVRLRPDGQIDGIVMVPARYVTSLCFDGSDLIVVSAGDRREPAQTGSIYRTTTSTRGSAVHPARVTVPEVVN